MQYELFYLVGERQEANLDAIKEGVNAILAEEKATMVGEEMSEKRKLAYEIKHQRKGTYITRRFELPEIDFWADEANGEKEFGIEAITKKMNLNNDVLRFIIVKTNELPDLGAKERRKAQELGNQKQQAPQKQAARPVRPQQTRVEAPKAAPKKEVAKEEVKEEVKAEKKEESKDIDKQLDELLNI